MEVLTVDRIEEGFAVCEQENLSIISLELPLLPKGTHAGSVLRKTSDGYELMPEEEQARKQMLFDMQNSLFDE